MPDKLPARRGVNSPYTEAEILECLTALAFHGQLKGTVEFLKKQKDGPKPGVESLRKWRDRTHVDEYLAIRERSAPQREKLLIDKIEPMIADGLDVTALALEKTREMLERDEVKDPAGTARNTATTVGILVDKKFAYEGRPTSTVVHRNPSEILRLLERRGMVRTVADVEGTVDEDVDKGQEPGVQS